MFLLKHKEVPCHFIQLAELEGYHPRVKWETLKDTLGWTYIENMLQATLFKTESEAFEARQWYGLGTHITPSPLSEHQLKLHGIST